MNSERRAMVQQVQLLTMKVNPDVQHDICIRGYGVLKYH